MQCDAQVVYSGVTLVLLEVLAVSTTRVENCTAFPCREGSLMQHFFQYAKIYRKLRAKSNFFDTQFFFLFFRIFVYITSVI